MSDRYEASGIPYPDPETKTPEEMREREKEIANEMTASEALYGFAGWLTSRDQQGVFSSRDNAALAADLVCEFCSVNKLSVPRNDWTDKIIMPRCFEGENKETSS